MIGFFVFGVNIFILPVLVHFCHAADTNVIYNKSKRITPDLLTNINFIYNLAFELTTNQEQAKWKASRRNLKSNAHNGKTT